MPPTSRGRSLDSVFPSLPVYTSQSFLEALKGGRLPLQTSARELDLSGADLRGVNFQGAWLDRCLLTGADLTGAVLASVKFNECDLAGAKLGQADLSGAEF